MLFNVKRKRGLNLGNADYNWFFNLLSFRALSKKPSIKTNRIVSLYFVIHMRMQSSVLTVSGLGLFAKEMLRWVEACRKRKLEKLHNEVLHALYSLFNIELIESRKLQWIIIRRGKRAIGKKFWLKNLEGRNHFIELSVVQKIVLKWIWRK